MATRFYLPSTGAAAVSPAFSASWDDTAAGDRIEMVVTKISSAMATISHRDNSNKNEDHLRRQYVSPPLDSGTFTATQALKLQMRVDEQSAGNNLFLTALLRFVSQDGTTFRSPVALTLTRDDTEAAAGTLTNRQYTATSGSAVTITQGDRLVLEIGCGGDPAGGGNHDMDFRVGDAAGSDLAENDTSTTDNNPWFEVADTLTIAANLTNQSINASATGTAVLTKVLTLGRTLPASATGTAILLKQSLVTLAATALGTAVLATIKSSFVTIAASAVGTATLSTVALFKRTLAATAVGTGVLARQLSLSRTLAATAVGSAVLNAAQAVLGWFFRPRRM